MNTPRQRFALLLLAASLTLMGCQNQAAAEVRPVVVGGSAGGRPIVDYKE